MPPTKDYSKPSYGRSVSNNGMSMSARVFHPATNLVPPTPPHSPTMTPTYINFPQSIQRPSTNSAWGRQNSQGGKYS